MGQIEREIKLLNVDVMKIKNTLHEKGIEPKGKYIQDVYTYDLLTVDGFYKKYIDEMISNNDNRGFFKLIKEIKPCFDKEDIKTINDVLGCDDILDYINSSNCDYNKLLSEKLIKLMEKTEDNFSKWIRLRQPGDETTITIKKIVEAGDFLFKDCGKLFCEVIDVRDNKMSQTVTLNFSKMANQRWAYPIYHEETKNELVDTVFYGCSCCETDIYLETKARRLKKGDKLMFQNISPYSYQWDTEFNGINKIRYDFKI